MASTPLMEQYREMKKQNADKVLFFRVGDFYEMFDQDALEISALLNLTLTHRGDDPMCGIPYHAAKNYIKRLLEEGKKVAICEQVELSDNAKYLAKREVVNTITPGTVVEEDFLDEKSFNYILTVYRNNCAFCDVTTGDFHLRKFENERINNLRSLIEQISPKEILVCEDEYYLDEFFKSAIDNSRAMITKLPPWYFTVKTCRELLCEQAGVKSLASFGLSDEDKVIGPAGALLRYVKETSKSSVSHLTNYKLDNTSVYVELDESSRKNLELFNNLYDGSSRFSLCETINRCKTSSGTRLLKQWISFPLRDINRIKKRQEWIKYYIDNRNELVSVREKIAGALDLNRLSTRVLLKKSVPHDLNAIKQSIGTFFSLIEDNQEKYMSLFEPNLLEEENLKQIVDLMTTIQSAINPETIGQYNEGQVIVNGYDAVLDEKRNLLSHSDSLLKDYLEQEKENSGITILKLGYNRVFGYYLEVPKGQIGKVPDYFLRKQTLVNGERFTTEKLQEFEKNILMANSQAVQREKEIYESILKQTLSLIPILNSIGHFLSLLDVFQSLATLAVDSSYVCPEITEEDVLFIEDGRHPVVEKQLGPGKFVENNLDMSYRFALITGPNMAGKSTYLRQNALIILLAHIGSFVPARSAKIGIVDKIFCRVGAMDNLARGQSTFMLEMQETAYIIRNCTNRSFVIVDEIGRGTSTQDGMALAYAVMKELISINSKTLFATHYHELTMIDSTGIKLLTLDVEENKGNVNFLRKIKEGVANSSYGIHVAKLAGVPSDVVNVAKKFQKKHFADYGLSQDSLFLSQDYDEPVIDENAVIKDKLFEEIRNLNLDECTPMQAMLYLSKFKEEIENF